MRSLLITAVAVSNCTALAADADEASADVDVSGAWYGTYESESNIFGGFGGRPALVLYVLDLSVTGEGVEGNLATGSGTDRRTSTQRAAAALGLPGNEGPKVPTPRPIAGAVEGKTLVLEAMNDRGPELTITAAVGRNRLRADVRSGQVVRTVLFRRCRPSRRNAAGNDCTLEALWEQYLRRSTRSPRAAPTAQDIQRITVPSTAPTTY